MTLEEYNQLDSGFAHCSGANCERASECLHNAAHKIRQFGIRTCLEQFQLPALLNVYGQCLGLVLEEAICGLCGTEVHEEVVYGAMT